MCVMPNVLIWPINDSLIKPPSSTLCLSHMGSASSVVLNDPYSASIVCVWCRTYLNVRQVFGLSANVGLFSDQSAFFRTMFFTIISYCFMLFHTISYYFILKTGKKSGATISECRQKGSTDSSFTHKWSGISVKKGSTEGPPTSK